MWLTQAASDDRWPRLPLSYGLKRVDQHDDIQGEIIANMKPDQNLERKRECDGQGNRKLSGRQKACDHGQRIGYRVDDAVAKIVQRHYGGAISLDNPVGVFNDLPAA